MKKIRNTRLRYGHAPGHVRGTFADAVSAFWFWEDNEPEPHVEFEINYVAHEIPISRACTLVWNCTDIAPNSLLNELEMCGVEYKRPTYAACARALHAKIQSCLKTE